MSEHMLLCVCVCACMAVLIAGTESISVIKQVLKRQGTVLMFTAESITEIGVIIQSDHRPSAEVILSLHCEYIEERVRVVWACVGMCVHDYVSLGEKP